MAPIRTSTTCRCQPSLIGGWPPRWSYGSSRAYKTLDGEKLSLDARHPSASRLRSVSSDRLTDEPSQWAHAMADAIVEGNVAPKYYNNLLDPLHSIVAWARIRPKAISPMIPS